MKLIFFVLGVLAIIALVNFSNAALLESQMVFVIDTTIFKNDTYIINNFYAQEGTYYDIPYYDSNYALIILSNDYLIFEEHITISFIPVGLIILSSNESRS